MFGITSFNYYGSKSRWLWEYCSIIPKKHYTFFLDACMGSGGVIATVKILDIENRIANEKDKNMFKLHQVLQKNYEGFCKELFLLEYDEQVFNREKENSKSNYIGYSDEKAAAIEYCQILYSMNNNRLNYRKKNEANADRSIRNAIFGLEEYSLAIRDVELRNNDCLEEIPKFIHLEDTFIFQDSPYRPKLRKSEHGYNVDTDEDWHKSFLELMQYEYSKGGISADMLICCYVDSKEAGDNGIDSMRMGSEKRKKFVNDMKEDNYCKALLPLGFKLVIAKRTVKPTVNKKENGKKNPAIECIFINYELDGDAYDYISQEDVFTYEEIFGE